MKRKPECPRGLGTFGGVFTPSVLTILGLILFLRLGYVTGAAGLPRVLLIVLLANAISVLTSISLSAIATNLRIKGGGDYYVISRTLGVEFGGALGLVLFLAQSVSIAFYSIGFGEAVGAMLGLDLPALPRIVAAGAVTMLFVLAWLGADWATRFQYVVMAVLFTAIAAFFVGGLSVWDAAQLRSNLTPAPVFDVTRTIAGPLPFWVIFALFFPAVTGFTQGVSMSGDLRNPGRSIPLGTFMAVGLSLVVYLGGALVFAGALPGTVLVSDYSAMRRISISPWLVDAGVVAATLSSALASFLGAPRILRSLAGDRVFPFLNLFAVGHGPTGNPRRAVLLSATIAYVTVALGDLNLIAPVVSMFFLISYGLLNYATYIEARANSPSFRPRFRFFHGRLSLIGALGCLGVMLAIHPTAALVAVVVIFAVHQYVAASVGVVRWADSGRSQRFQRVREDLHAIAGEPEHPRYWRPVLLAFSDDPARRERILRFASWLDAGSGLTTAVRFVEGKGPGTRKIRREVEKELRDEIEERNFPAFPRAVVAPDLEVAVPVMLQSYGLGPVRANTVLLNWFDRRPDDHGLRSYGRYLRLALRYACNLVILGADAERFEALEKVPRRERRIDVWHRDNATGRLMLLLAYLMTRNEGWADARIRLLAPAAKETSDEETLRGLERMLEEVRIAAEPEVVNSSTPAEVVRHSADASLLFLPFRLGEEGAVTVFDWPAEDLLQAVGITAMVLAAEDIVLDTEPEAGVGEIAQAIDAASKAREIAVKAEEEHAETDRQAQERLTELEQARAAGAGADDFAELESAVREAGREAEQARRRLAKARAKADAAAEEAESLTGKPSAGDWTKTPKDPGS